MTVPPRSTDSVADADMLLVSMPYADVLRPPLGVSVLLGALRRQKIRVKAIYPSVSLADELPFDVYRWFGANVQNRFGDYFFANRIFGYDDVRRQALMRQVRQLESIGRYPHLTGMPTAESFVTNIETTQLFYENWLDCWVDRICRSPMVKVVACSASLVQLCASLALLKAVKHRRPDVVTMIGGCECEGEPALEIASKFRFVDYVLSGDGDETLPWLAKECLSGGHPHGRTLPFGIFDCDKAAMGKTESSKVLPEKFGWPCDSDYFEAVRGSRRYCGVKGCTTMEFSRGCWKGEWSQCLFCGMNGERMVFRCKSADRILDELRAAYAQGVRVFMTTDTVLDLRRVLPVLSRFGEEAPDVAYVCDVVATLDEETLVRLADCGALVLQVGIESLHPRHVSLLSKGNHPWRSLEFLKFAEENHIHVFWNLITSIPGDRPAEYDELMKLMPLLEHLSAPSFSLVRFDRFSEYWKDPSRYGLRLVPMACNHYLYPADGRVDLSRISMYYENANEDVRTSASHSSLKACAAQVHQWNRRRGDAVLCQDATGLITDTRSCAVDKFYRPNVQERQVLDLLRFAMPDADIASKFSVAGVADVEDVLGGLIDRGFVVHWDGHWLSLVMRTISSEREHLISRRSGLVKKLLRQEVLLLSGKEENAC